MCPGTSRGVRKEPGRIHDMADHHILSDRGGQADEQHRDKDRGIPGAGRPVRTVQGIFRPASHQAEDVLPGLHPAGAGG